MRNDSKANRAPIVLFVYNRMNCTKTVIEALKVCPESRESELFVFSDGPKDASVKNSVQEVRDYLHTVDGFKNIKVYERAENWGIEKSEIDGITSVIKKHGQAIILEDDIVVGPYFLRYMNLALEKYKSYPDVYSVTGYSFLNEEETENVPEYGFLSLASVWGWGTWQEKWERLKKKIDIDDIRILFNKKARARFNCGYYYADMLYTQYKAGYITWDMAWYWTIYINNGMTLAPARTMVNNIGMDGSGTHYTDKNGKNRIEHIEAFVYSDQLPNKVMLDKQYCDAVEKHLRKMCRQNAGKIYNLLRELRKILIWKVRELTLTGRKK